jgi:hypothetical protein
VRIAHHFISGRLLLRWQRWRLPHAA